MAKQRTRPLAERVSEAAEAALAAQNYVSVIDVFRGIGWLPGGLVVDWQHGRADALENLLQINPERIDQAIKLLQSWSAAKGLIASEAEYISRTPQRQPLRFTADSAPAVEQAYRTHWVSPTLSEKKRERLAEKTNQPPELVVIQPLNKEWKCHRCSKQRGALIIMEKPGPVCMPCAGLGDLEFLPSGDALLTRRTKAKSARHAVVVRFSRARGRYERQGLLVEPQALAAAEREVADKGR